MIKSFYLSHTLYIIANLEGNQAKSIFQCSYLIHYTLLFLPCLGHDYVSVASLIIKTSFHMPFPWHTRHARVMSLASTLYYWEKISNTRTYMKFQINSFAQQSHVLQEIQTTLPLLLPSLSIVCCCNEVYKPTFIFVNNQQVLQLGLSSAS